MINCHGESSSEPARNSDSSLWKSGRVLLTLLLNDHGVRYVHQSIRKRLEESIQCELTSPSPLEISDDVYTSSLINTDNMKLSLVKSDV